MDFAALKDMALSITRNKIKQISVLGNPGNEGNRTELLYEGIVKGTFNSDTAASQHFFGDPIDPRYRKLKSQLTRQLISTAFFVDVHQPMFNERAKAYYNCYRDFAAAYILILREASKAGSALMHTILEQSIKFEFVGLAAEIARYLRKEYARNISDQASHERIANLHRQYEEKRRLEILALDCFENLVNYYIVRCSPSEEVHRRATAYFDELLPLALQADTCQFYYYTYQIGIIKHLSVNDCVGALALCEESFGILKERKNTNRGSLVGILLQKIACLIQLRILDNKEYEAAITYCLDISEEGALNWFRTLELHLYYCLFARRYTEALEIYKKVSQHERFGLLTGVPKDNWQLFAGYLHLLAALGKLDADKVKSIVGIFRNGKLANEIKIVDKDKEGMNIPLLLLPVLYHLAKGTFERSNISIEALEKYRKRYMDNALNRRSAAFLNMLLAFAGKDYASASAQKKIKKEMEILTGEQPQVATQTFAVEIVPYEDLWEMLTER